MIPDLKLTVKLRVPAWVLILDLLGSAFLSHQLPAVQQLVVEEEVVVEIPELMQDQMQELMLVLVLEVMLDQILEQFLEETQKIT